MCGPVSMTLLAAGAAGGGSLLSAGALTGTAITGGMLASAGASAALAGATTYMGMQGADAARGSHQFAAQGHMISANEMMKQIEVVETQAMIDELQRRNEYAYLTAENMAAATVTGVRVDSSSFEAIQRRNDEQMRKDQSIADLNTANQKGQLAGQAGQYTRAAFAELKAGQTAYKEGMFGTAMTVLDNFPRIDLGKIGRIGGSGITNPSKTLMAQVQKAVS